MGVYENKCFENDQISIKYSDLQESKRDCCTQKKNCMTVSIKANKCIRNGSFQYIKNDVQMYFLVDHLSLSVEFYDENHNRICFVNDAK